ncbi:unnamed protein product [Allacma fusca]|uniref:Kinase n=1 Tax=Allacma fusca TaxID=39272 RepID=A0A8J2Q757_9HEXA|nr:unnamed protein product [Allacma fusca]
MPMEDILNEIQECEPVPLEIYCHQVGGHSSILCLDERTVCKPLIKQELKFYEMLPSSMKKFTPEYRGVVQVRFEEDQDGYIRVAAYPPKSFRYKMSSSEKTQKSRRIRLKNSGSIEIEIESELEESSASTSSNSTRSVRPHNPWVLKCHRDHLSKIKRSGNSHPQKEKESHAQKFMLLENLTWRFEYPCVLDLKMGTRQYGDDATPAKIESQCAKAASSTSVQLGVRICGMQVYQTTNGKFMCRNKYYGRKLDVEGFREALCQFLHNGNRLRTDALVPLVEKLQELKAVLSNLDTFRFYTSSLLLIYEGLDPEYHAEDESFIRAEPYANDLEKMEGDSENKFGPPTSSRSADNIFSGQSQDANVEQNLRKSMSNSSEALNSTCRTVQSSIPNSSSRSKLGSRGSIPSCVSLSSESVDVRMIDFAHATHNGLGLGHCAKEHAGPDTGYIFGLSNLITTLEEIIEQECTF